MIILDWFSRVLSVCVTTLGSFPVTMQLSAPRVGPARADDVLHFMRQFAKEYCFRAQSQ